MIREFNQYFVLETRNSSYVFCVMETGHLKHLYYGRKIKVVNPSSYMRTPVFGAGNTIVYDSEHPQITMTDVCLEVSTLGKGDIREPMIELMHEDGNRTNDFVFESYEIMAGKADMQTLPSAYGSKEDVQTLCITLKNKEYPQKLQLYYSVFEETDVITRRAVLINQGEDKIRLYKMCSACLDFPKKDYKFTGFCGAWTREMERYDQIVSAGTAMFGSVCGTSSSRANPFVMIAQEDTTEDNGECYGCNLIYSGNHYESLSVSEFGKTRFIMGIHPQDFSYLLEKDETFETPEAVFTFSTDGYNGMSQNMHTFVRNHIVRGAWKNKVRPVLLNSWEAAYFDINESKLVSFAKEAKKVGIELFVMDDGWFGERNDDSSSLGDWYVNKKKLPNGLKGICDKIKKEGLSFGIWVEPEMVNVNSRLYRKHPEWVMDVDGKTHAEGRNQRILDLSNPKVQEYIITSMSEVFASADISYVKWDMNRIFSDVYSKYLPIERKQETAHRYIVGLYHVMEVLTKKFPDILFEGCAAGGNRFDLGILCYFPQIWASDNTDALCRVKTQTNYSYGYPMSTVSAHVSGCPNHQTLRVTPLETRFHVASFGVLGYECNLKDMSSDEVAAIKEQIETYKKWRDVLQSGRFYRGRNGNIHEMNCVSEDKSKAVGMVMQEMIIPNMQNEYFYAKGLEEDMVYHFYNRKIKHDIRDFGDLVNTMTPIHVKPDSLMQKTLAKIVKLDSEIQECEVSGGELMYAGMALAERFVGVGFNDSVRHFPDFASRMYFMEKTIS